MPELKKLMEDIEIIRRDLQQLIGKKKDMLDPEIITVSRLLDVMLNEYFILLKEKDHRSQDDGEI